MKTLSTPHYFACKRLGRTLSIDDDCGPNRMDGLPECVGCGRWALSQRQQIGALETEWTRNFTEVGA